MSSYGQAGKEYINWCANMAVSQNVGVPWIMCQQSDAPQPMVYLDCALPLFFLLDIYI